MSGAVDAEPDADDQVGAGHGLDRQAYSQNEKTLVALIKSNLLQNIQIYNMSSFQLIQLKTV